MDIRQPVLRRYFSVIFFITLFFWAAAGLAQDAPIHIEADRMVSQEQKNSVVFLGNVDAKQDDIIIRTDEMTVYYVPDESGGKVKKRSSQVEKLICKGNVEISRGNWLGTGKRMDYFASERKVILSGDAKAWQDTNMVSGKKIIYYLDEGRSFVEGDSTVETAQNQQNKPKSGRVQAVINPESDGK